MVEIYPREGTETQQQVQTAKFAGLKFNPARGRKRAQHFEKHLFHNVEIYPREGTETPCDSATSYIARPLKFIPVRGRKLALGLVKLNFIR